jgi:hypothetical protein
MRLYCTKYKVAYMNCDCAVALELSAMAYRSFVVFTAVDVAQLTV